LIYGKSAAELEIVASNTFTNIKNRGYRPYEANLIGLPYAEVGDYAKLYTDDIIIGFIFKRTLSGIQALRDTYSATGNKELTQNFGVNNEIIQLLGKSAILKKSVEQVSVAVTDLDTQLTGEIDVLAGKVILKVTSSGEIASVELNADPSEGSSVLIKAVNIALEGIVTANGKFKILLDGSMETTDGTFSGTVQASTILGCAIKTGEDGYIQSSDWDLASYGIDFNEIYISSGVLKARRTRYFNDGSSTSTSEATMTCNELDINVVTCNFLGLPADPVSTGYISSINGGTPITTANKNNYTYPSTTSGASGSFTSANGKTVTVSNGLITSIA